ncbi:Glycosyltransferase sdnJ [Colletotrichum trifolii]|uniref:Glycosyltransferase sdnJ n=1 Tax=Colletotrichum trifolii TaxID=5466 RepID=A0A4R8QLL1_COLTR|nr:Glycosyltransferase sdnJ [Colletotrichum trifolii]
MLLTSLVQSASLGLGILFPRLVKVQSTTEFTRSDAPPPELYLRRGAAIVTVLGDYLYIDGGEVSQLDLEGNPIKDRDSNAVNSTLSIDLSKSWTASNVSIRVIEKAAPKMDGQVIWKHEGMKTFFVWGGHKPYGGKVDAPESWKFEADGQGGDEWVTETSANPAFYSELRRTEEGAYVSTPDAGFVFGGIATGWTNANPASQPVPGVLSYNMTTTMWTNETTPGFSGFSKHATMVGGGAVYIPTFGDNGLTVVMGGSTWTLQPSQSSPDGWMDFGNLTFYDPISKDWYWQQTTGTAPTARRGFCYVGAEGKNGTYEIFVFGGTNSDTGSSFDDVYVLSLPGFVWTQVPYESKITRRSHSCAVVGRRQMLSVGGTDGKTGWSGRDMWPQGLGLFDMTEWYWKDTYDAEAKDYETSKTIQEWYEKGGVDEIKWSLDRVQELFVNSTATINPTGVLDGPTSTPTAKRYLLPPGLVNTCRALSGLPELLCPWRPDEFVGIHDDLKRLHDEIKPDITVVDDLFAPGLSFARNAKVNWIALAPNVIKDFAIPMQPYLAALWKYPAIGTGFKYPIPWNLIPWNVFFTLVSAFAILTDKTRPRLAQHLRKTYGPDFTLTTMADLGLLTPAPEGIKVLVANSPDIDLPLSVLPDHIIPCGPIIRAAPPICVVDPGLTTWLKRGPTIYMNLGTHMGFSLDDAKEVAYAFRALFDHASSAGSVREDNFQILWKLPRELPEGQDANDFTGEWTDFTDILRQEIEDDRARIMDWFAAEAKSILESGEIVCSINHGGANSFHEALCAGVPQVVLPRWADCYDFASRAELLGIGKRANHRKHPWHRSELGEALIAVIIGPEARAIQERAKSVAKRHPETEGRVNAAKEILDRI